MTIVLLRIILRVIMIWTFDLHVFFLVLKSKWDIVEYRYENDPFLKKKHGMKKKKVPSTVIPSREQPQKNDICLASSSEYFVSLSSRALVHTTPSSLDVHLLPTRTAMWCPPQIGFQQNNRNPVERTVPPACRLTWPTPFLVLLPSTNTLSVQCDPTFKRGWCGDFNKVEIRNLWSLLVCPQILGKILSTDIDWIFGWRSRTGISDPDLVLVFHFFSLGMDIDTSSAGTPIPGTSESRWFSLILLHERIRKRIWWGNFPRLLTSCRKLQLYPLGHCPLDSHCRQSPRILCTRCCSWILDPDVLLKNFHFCSQNSYFEFPAR